MWKLYFTKYNLWIPNSTAFCDLDITFCNLDKYIVLGEPGESDEPGETGEPNAPIHCNDDY